MNNEVNGAATILREIVAGCPDFSLVRRAGNLLRRGEPARGELWKLYKLALASPGAEYSPEARAAMEQLCAEQRATQDFNRSVTVRFRCTANERARIELLAAREGKTLSEFIRDRCTAD